MRGKNSSIRFSNEGRTWFSLLSFKFMEMVECKTSLKGQCPCDWLRTHAETTWGKQSTILWEICHVKGGLNCWLSQQFV
jgi:hypothetical protein